MWVKSILSCALLLPLLSTAQPDELLSQDDMLQAFEEAQARFQSEITAPPLQLSIEEMLPTLPEIAEQVDIQQPNQVQIDVMPHDAARSGKPNFIVQSPSMAPQADLAALRVNVNFERVSLQQAVANVIADAGDKVGPWDVSWRLSPENMYLLEEQMNLTAETTLGRFLQLIAERVNNLTGVELFVSVFDANRLILITDTYF